LAYVTGFDGGVGGSALISLGLVSFRPQEKTLVGSFCWAMIDSIKALKLTPRLAASASAHAAKSAERLNDLIVLPSF
jgi:hypothetical protein